MGAVLPAEGAQALLAGLAVLADRADRAGPDDPCNRDQRRADALVQLGIDALTGYPTCPTCGTRMAQSDFNSMTGATERGEAGDVGSGDVGPGDVGSGGDGDVGPAGPRWQGLRPSVQVSVALSTLLGLDEQPGELAGHGPIPAALARRMAADPTGTWRRLVTDPLGHLVDYGRTRYRPPADVREYVLARDGTCRFPTCSRPARRATIDHVVPWAKGGRTAEPNLLTLCSRHHHAKDEAGWRITLHHDRSATWTSPTGHTSTTPPATYPLDGSYAMYARNDTAELRGAGDATAAMSTSDDNLAGGAADPPCARSSPNRNPEDPDPPADPPKLDDAA